MKFTLDSNVWERVVAPNDYSSSPDNELYVDLNHKIQIHNNNEYWISSVVFSLEEIERKYRLIDWRTYRPSFSTQIQEENGGINMTISLAPDNTFFDDGRHGVSANQILINHANTAFQMGFKVITDSRIGLPHHAFIDNYILDFDDEKNNLTSDVSEYIENTLHAGKYILHKLLQDNGLDMRIISEIRKLPDACSKKFASAMAEWADGDAIAQHIGYGGNYFVTNDNAHSAGSTSVMSPDNVKKLSTKYGFLKISPSEFLSML